MAANSEPTTDEEIIVSKREAHRFVVDIMRKHKVLEEHASAMADVLVEADYQGHFSHGLNRIKFYVDTILEGGITFQGDPQVVAERAGTALVDGRKLLGPVVGTFAMRMAIAKARETGIGCVTVRNSNHYGIAGWYSTMGLKEGMIGISMTTSSPVTFPPRSKQQFLGTNPISVAAPSLRSEDDFIFDGALSTVAWGKVEMCKLKRREIPFGWTVDSQGQLCTDVEGVFKHGGLTPLGTTDEQGGYKGSGLIQSVEILCSLLSGGLTSDEKGWALANPTSHCFMAIDTSAFAPNFDERVSDFVGRLRSLDTLDGQPILAPGDPERSHMAKCQRLGGIPYHPNLIADLNEQAESYGVVPLKGEQPRD